ncbi:MAG TPA: hypothetical protein VHM90_01445, partial [Phycisphaerae bacterium]|nr:hypothetical protein [Phycisphaerae bacterium]
PPPPTPLGFVGGTLTGTVQLNGGFLTVSNGATFNSGTGPITINKTGNLLINGGTFNANGHLVVDGGTVDVAAVAGSQFNLANGKNFTAQNSAYVHLGSSASVPFQSLFIIQSGSRLVCDAGLNLGGGLLIDGTGTFLGIGASSSWGSDTQNLIAQFSNNATASIAGTLTLAPSPSAKNANVSVQNGAQLYIQSLRMAPNGSGTNSTLSVFQASITIVDNLVVGAPAGGSAAIYIDQNSTFNTFGPVTIDHTGTVLLISNFTALEAIDLFGTLTIGFNNGNTGNFVGFRPINLASGGNLVFNRSNAMTINTAIQGAGGTLSQIGTGTTTLAGAYSATGRIQIAAGNLTFAPTNAPRQTSAILLTTDSLNIANNSVMDITNHDLMITNNNASSSNYIINSLWKNGTAALLGTGNPAGPQITSSTATNNTTSFPTFIVAFDIDHIFGTGGISDGSGVGVDYGAYTDHQIITQPGTIMIKYGYYADIDFSGKVDAGDINLILGTLGQTTPGMTDPGLSYLLGDVDYSGKVDAGDINLVLGMLGAGSGGVKGNPLGDLDPVLASISDASPVPEPSTACLWALPVLQLLWRKRNKP